MRMREWYIVLVHSQYTVHDELSFVCTSTVSVFFCRHSRRRAREKQEHRNDIFVIVDGRTPQTENRSNPKSWLSEDVFLAS